MLYQAKNGIIPLEDTDMPYLSFGHGSRALVMIPGVGDGLKTVRGLALPFAWMYRKFAKDFTIYVFSRKNRLPQGYSTKDMAQDQREAMEKLGISSASVVGISQGGMIAQHLAIDAPQLVEELVLAVTAAQPNDTLTGVIGAWANMARCGDYRSLMIDTTEKAYTQKALRAYRPFYPILGRLGKPKSFQRFLVQAEACLHHNALEGLNQIQCPTLVIGAEEDRVLGAAPSRELAAQIGGSQLYMYEGYGHGVYTEAKDFDSRVLAFLKG